MRRIRGKGLTIMAFLLLIRMQPSALGQVIPCQGCDPAGMPRSQPQPPMINGPGPYNRPTEQQTRYFIESDPNLRTLDSSLKDTLIYNLSNPWLNSSILPNGRPNPLYHPESATVMPNWYIRSTWPL